MTRYHLLGIGACLLIMAVIVGLEAIVGLVAMVRLADGLAAIVGLAVMVLPADSLAATVGLPRLSFWQRCCFWQTVWQR